MRDFDIPAQDLAAALRLLGRQARIDVLFTAQTVAGRRSAAVRARLSPAAAAAALLRAHPDLEAVVTADGTLLVRRRRAFVPPPSAAPASPQRRPAPAPAEDDAEVVVTALRRPIQLRLYPGSARVLTGREVERRGRTSLSDAAALVPGLNLTDTGAGQRRITMRGIHSAGENSVLLYLDETPISGPSSATSDVSQISPDIRLFDVERIEVLRGPQGTLFGSGALGGAVRILFAKPDPDRFAAEAVLGGAQVEQGGAATLARATLNLPVAQGIALRATGYDERTPGVIDNRALGIADVDRSRATGGRLMLRAQPAPGADLTATLLGQRQRVRDSSGSFPALGAYRTDLAERLPFPNDLLLYSLAGNLDLGATQLTATAAQYRWTMTRTIDSSRAASAAAANGTYCPLFAGAARCDDAQLAAYRGHIAGLLPLVGSQPMRVEATVAELRAVARPAHFLTLTGGVFLESRADESRSGTYRADPATGRKIEPEQSSYLRTVFFDTRQTAAFADVTAELPGGVTLGAGVRRYGYRKAATAQVLQTSYVNGAVAGPPVARAQSSQGWTGRLNLAWQARPDLLLFSQVASGFRPGGVNSVPNLPAGLVDFRADSVVSVENGFRWSGRGIDVNGALFWTDWHDMQTSARVPSFTFVSNSGAARIVGADLEAEAAIGAGLKLKAALNLLDAALTRDQSNSVVAAPGRRGDRIPFEPDMKALLQAEHAASLPGGIVGVAAVDLSYTGAAYSEYRPDSPLYERMGGYADVTVRWGARKGRWSLDLTVTNLLNVAGKRRVESFVNIERLTYALRPRTIGVDLGWRLGQD